MEPRSTRCLSVHQCIKRVLEQWSALELFFTGEVFDDPKSLQSDRLLKSPYIKATLEFCDYVLGDLTGLKLMFQSDTFQLQTYFRN